MKPSEYLKSKCSAEMYLTTWGTREEIPREMDELFISKDEIRGSLKQHHRKECKGCITSPLIVEAKTTILTCPCVVCKQLCIACKELWALLEKEK